MVHPRPNLNGLFGRQSGTTAGYSYSAANKNMAVAWGENTLYDYLLNPKKIGNCPSSLRTCGLLASCFFPRCDPCLLRNLSYITSHTVANLKGALEADLVHSRDKDGFPGLKKPQDRADLIAYLKESTA
ncbi:Cytochrome c [Vitis vinifera]|uniref:Cytochrome c n=1 Tax=Vitis vinifera TaxID=29760 RepID=A0A438D0D6_VITVI|nr:Cytochrome c [Vitis vinifera]